jgi:hypothetical protein
VLKTCTMPGFFAAAHAPSFRHSLVFFVSAIRTSLFHRRAALFPAHLLPQQTNVAAPCVIVFSHSTKFIDMFFSIHIV